MLEDKELQQHVNFLILNWNSPDAMVSEVTIENQTDKKWWQFWKLDSNQKNNIQNIVRYLLESTDDFLQILYKKYGAALQVDQIVTAVSQLYDTVVKLPLWLTPFSASIKNVVLTLIPVLVEFLNTKYGVSTNV
jgi:heptaprenylglyceryl phosphate synthase